MLISTRENEKLKDVPVTYFSKISDGSQITSALARRGISFTIATPEISERFQTNTIRCGPNAPAAAIKEVALAILESGGLIHVIERTRSPTSAPNGIYLLARATLGGNVLVHDPLSRAQINAISECPSERLSNLPTYEPPRPTGLTNEKRLVSFYGDKNWNTDGQLVAAGFCRLRGHLDVVLYREGFADSGEQTVIHLNDQSICDGPSCRYFTKVICY
jgi:hypothetical protein